MHGADNPTKDRHEGSLPNFIKSTVDLRQIFMSDENTSYKTRMK